MATLRLAGPVGIVRQIDTSIWKIVPAPWMNMPAFYTVSSEKPVLKPCPEMIQDTSGLGFKTLEAAKKFQNYGIGPNEGYFHPAELLYGADRFTLTLRVLSDREDRQFHNQDAENQDRISA